MTSNHHALYDLGYTRTTMALNKEKQDREVEQNSETTSQFGLQAATRLHRSQELLVIVDQHATVNTFPGLVHRPSHHESQGDPKSVSLTARRTPPKVKLVIGGEVVTR